MTTEEITLARILFENKVRRVNTDRMMVSKILRTLQINGLIKRIEHETDTRAKCVFLTETGTAILQNAIKIKTEANQSFFKNLSEKQKFEEELKRLTE